MLRRNEDGEPLGFTELDHDCGLDKAFFANNSHLLDGDYDGDCE